MTDLGPGSSPALPEVYTDGFRVPDLLQSIISGFRTSPISEENRFWSTGERYATDPTREVLDITFGGSRLINFISFQTAHFPHTVRAEFYDEQTGTWQPFLASVVRRTYPALRQGVFTHLREVGKTPVSYTISDSLPPRVNLLPAASGIHHPQHFGPGHWTSVAWRVRPVQVRRMRLVLTRSTTGYPPADAYGKQVPYSLGIRNLQPGYRINSRLDIPRYGDIETHSEDFASSNDVLGSRVIYSLREQKPQAVQDGSPDTYWRSSPQPVNYAVVNFYADTRDSTGAGQVIDRFFVDPTTVGAHVNLYYSNDTPDTDFEASDEPLTYPISQDHGDIPPAHNDDVVQWSGTAVSYTDIDNTYLQFDATKDWWLGLSMYASQPYGATGDWPWFSFGENVLRQHDSAIEFITENGEVVSLPLPADHLVGGAFSVTVAYAAAASIITMTYRLGDEEPQVLVLDVARLVTRVATLSIGRYPDSGSPGVSGLNLRALILKVKTPLPGEIAAFTDDPSNFVRKDDYPEFDNASADNAILRMHPSFSTPTVNQAGLLGGPGDRYADMTWTPIFHDFTLKKGFLEIPPTRARYWKFEFTKLVPEVYQSFVPILRQVRLFTTQTVSRFNEVGGFGPFNPKSGGDGVRTMLALDVGRYGEALEQLQQRAPSTATEVLYADNLAQASRLSDQGWIWAFQPWHVGSYAPRFVDTTVHRYETVTVEHRSKVGYFAGLRSLQAFRVDYLADDDTARYIDHLLDQQNIASLTGVEMTESHVLGLGASGEVVSKAIQSTRPIRGLQFATIQTDAFEMLADDGFRDPVLGEHWYVYGDAQLTLNTVQHSVLVNRGWYARTYGLLEPGGEVGYGHYSDMDGRLYGEIEGGQPNGLAGGGISSQAVTPSGSGRVYAAVKVSAEQTLNAPLILQIVSAQTGLVLASAQRTLRAGETQTMWVGYTPGSVSSPLLYSDLEGTLYGDLDGTLYSSHESLPIGGEVYARLVQMGNTHDQFTVQRLSMFDDPITWEFSVDDGVTWFDARDVRNNPDGVLSFPVPGTKLKWRLRTWMQGTVVSALAIRPWYGGLLGGVPNFHGMHVNGPNRSVQDQYPEIHDDPLWQQWDEPIPHGWYTGSIFAALEEGGDTDPIQPEPPGPQTLNIGAQDNAPAFDSATAVISGAPARLARQDAEVVIKGDSKARVARQDAEVIIKGDSKARLARQDAEVVIKGDSKARVARQSVEVVVQNTPTLVGVVTSGGGNSFNAPLPTNVAGQPIIVAVNNDRNQTLVVPSGWTRHGTADRSYCHVEVFSKVSTGTETTFAVSCADGTTTCDVVALVYSTGTVKSVNTGTAGGSTFTQPVVPTLRDRRVVHATAGQTGVVGQPHPINLGPDVTYRGEHHSGTLDLTVGDFFPGIDGYSPAESTSPDTADNWAGVTISIGTVSGYTDDFNRSDRELIGDRGWYITYFSQTGLYSVTSNRLRTLADTTGFPGSSGTIGNPIAHAVTPNDSDVEDVTFDIVTGTLTTGALYFVLGATQDASSPPTINSGVLLRWFTTGTNNMAIGKITATNSTTDHSPPTWPALASNTTTTLRVKLTRSTGVVQVWVNGALQYTSGAGDFSGLTGSIVAFQLQKSYANNPIEIDNLAVS